MYFAPGATHAPHQVPKEWIDRFKGQFDMGWDTVREETFARQKQVGVIPQQRQADAPAPDSFAVLGSHQRRCAQTVFSRQMEVFAGFTAHADHEVGRLIEAIEKARRDSTTRSSIYIVGDNGASARGASTGCSTR